MIFSPIKVGIVACSGEEFVTGTVSRIAARMVVENVRPGATVITCLPLLMSGGEEERRFVEKFPTITIDGCELDCTVKTIVTCGGNPRFSISIKKILEDHPEISLEDSTIEKLGPNGLKLASIVAETVAKRVDEILKEETTKK